MSDYDYPNDVTPVSVTYVGICSELCPKNFGEESLDGHSYTMGTVPTEYCDTLLFNIPEVDHILVAVSGSLSAIVERGFVGFSLYNYWIKAFRTRPTLLVGNEFRLSARILQPFVESGLASGSVPVVYVDGAGNTYVVRYPFGEAEHTRLQRMGIVEYPPSPEADKILEAQDESDSTEEETVWPAKIDFSITAVPDAVRNDLLCLGEHLGTFRHSEPTAYAMYRDENPEIFDAFGDRILGRRMLCIFVNSNELYQDAIENWKDIYRYVPIGNEKYRRAMVNFDGRRDASWLNIGQFDFSAAYEKESRGVYVLLTGPSNSTLFTLPFVGRDEFESSEMSAELKSVAPLILNVNSPNPLELSGDSDENIGSYPVKPTQVYTYSGDWFKLEGGEIVYGDFLEGYFGPNLD